MNSCPVRQFFLADSERLTSATQIGAHAPTNIHASEKAKVSPIGLQPMSLILFDCPRKAWR